MPRFMKRKRSYIKKGYSSKKRKQNKRFRVSNNWKAGSQSTVYVPGRTLMPERLRTRFVYADTKTVTSTLGVQTGYIWRGNGPYDPDQTGTGQQPPGYDDIAGWYGAYYVLGSSVKVTFLNQTSGVPAKVALLPYYSSSDSTVTFDTLASIPMSKRSNLTGNGALGIKILYSKTTVRSMLGMDPYGENMQASFGSAPAQQFYWWVIVQPADENSTMSISFDIVITYDVVLTHRKNLINS